MLRWQSASQGCGTGQRVYSLFGSKWPSLISSLLFSLLCWCVCVNFSGSADRWHWKAKSVYVAQFINMNGNCTVLNVYQNNKKKDFKTNKVILFKHLQFILYLNHMRNCKPYNQFTLKLYKLKSNKRQNIEWTDCIKGTYGKSIITYVLFNLSRCLWDMKWKWINHKTNWRSCFCCCFPACVLGELRGSWCRVVFLEVWSVTWNISVCSALPHSWGSAAVSSYNPFFLFFLISYHPIVFELVRRNCFLHTTASWGFWVSVLSSAQ